MRRALMILFLALALPAHAHHTREHVLGAPTPPPAVTAPAAPDDAGGDRLLWALGPFFLLVAVGALRWGYRHHRDGKDKNRRG